MLPVVPEIAERAAEDGTPEAARRFVEKRADGHGCTYPAAWSASTSAKLRGGFRCFARKR